MVTLFDILFQVTLHYSQKEVSERKQWKIRSHSSYLFYCCCTCLWIKDLFLNEYCHQVVWITGASRGIGMFVFFFCFYFFIYVRFWRDQKALVSVFYWRRNMIWLDELKLWVQNNFSFYFSAEHVFWHCFLFSLENIV